MTNSSRRWFSRLAVAVAVWPAIAEAQTPVRSFEELTAIVKAEETVIVIDMRGRKVKGALTGIDQDSLSLAADGRLQTFARSEVRTLRLADDFVNGTLIGGGVGLGAALSILAIAGSRDGYVLPSAKVGAPLLLSGIGALLGALIDRAHEGGRVLYVSPGQTLELAVSPLWKDRQCVLVSVRF